MSTGGGVEVLNRYIVHLKLTLPWMRTHWALNENKIQKKLTKN